MVRGLESPHRIGGNRPQGTDQNRDTPAPICPWPSGGRGPFAPWGTRCKGKAMAGLVGPQAAMAGNLFPGSRWSREWVQRRGDIICERGHDSSLAIWAVGGAVVMLLSSSSVHLSPQSPQLLSAPCPPTSCFTWRLGCGPEAKPLGPRPVHPQSWGLGQDPWLQPAQSRLSKGSSGLEGLALLYR